MDECLGYVELTVQEAATKALGSFLTSREDDKQQVAPEVKGAKHFLCEVTVNKSF